MAFLGLLATTNQIPTDDENASHIPPNLPFANDTKPTKGPWSQFTTTQTVVISAVTTATTLAILRVYKTYLRRIPSVDHLKPTVFRSRSFYGYVTRVGDGDNFHFFHTPAAAG